jgi:glycosyltransferase involved in cell wall biosynthesis
LGFIAKHPSVERIVPNKVYQGMALGKTVVTASAAAISSILADQKEVYLVEPDNAESLADAIMYLQNNPKVNAGIARAGREVFLTRFTPTAVGGMLENYLRTILK